MKVKASFEMFLNRVKLSTLPVKPHEFFRFNNFDVVKFFQNQKIFVTGNEIVGFGKNCGGEKRVVSRITKFGILWQSGFAYSCFVAPFTLQASFLNEPIYVFGCLDASMFGRPSSITQ